MALLRRWSCLAIAVCVAGSIAAAPIGTKVAAHSADASSSYGIAKKRGISREAVKLHDKLLRVWSDHAIWSWQYTVSKLEGLENQQAVANRLQRNLRDISQVIGTYYGQEMSGELMKLLSQHIQIAGKLIEAVKAGHQAEAEEYKRLWHKNAADIARFLSKLNPNWSYEELKRMMNTHLQLMTEGLHAHLNKNWEAEIIAVDKNQHHLNEMADMLALGIMKQSPKKFK